MDTFDALAAKWFSLDSADSLASDGVPRSPFRRVIMFVDNAGMQPLLWAADCMLWRDLRTAQL